MTVLILNILLYTHTIAPCVYMYEDGEFHNRNRKKKALEMGTVGGQRLFEGLSHNITIIKWQATYFLFLFLANFLSPLCIFIPRQSVEKEESPTISMICLFFLG